MNAPTNMLLLEVAKHLDDTIEFESGVKLYVDTTLEKQDKVSLIAKVAALPRDISPGQGQEGMNFDGVKVGDEVMIRYDVLAETDTQPDRDSTRYKHEFMHGNKRYWLADLEQVFAYRRWFESPWVMLNGYLKVTPVKKINEDYSKFIIRPDSYRVEEQHGIGTVDESETEGFTRGSGVMFVYRFAQSYSINGKQFYIIRAKHVMAEMDS